MRILGLLLLWAGVLAASSPFDGRWDITVTGDNSRAWWLELEGAGTPAAKGTFVSDYFGDRNKIDEISLNGDELTFGFRHRENGSDIHNIYTARLQDGNLVGSMRTEGSSKAPQAWTGVRAPAIPDKDDGSWRESQPITLFSHKDTSGWRSLTPGKPFGWTVEEGILKSTGGASNLISDQKFWNFKLHVEFRLGTHSNSGIGLRARADSR